MIRRDDILHFFEKEAIAERERWETLMKLPIKERVRKRKAIESVVLDPDYLERKGNYCYLKVRAANNLSDFKEGEAVTLHRPRVRDGIQANIAEFVGDEDIILEVYAANLPADVELKSYHGKALQLDKTLVNLWDFVYSRFMAELSLKPEFWDELWLNTHAAPDLKDLDVDRPEVKKMLAAIQMDCLLPAQFEAVARSLSTPDYYLIQGPPGTGKSFVLGLIIVLECLMDRNLIVIGPNHMAINNTLGQVMKLAPGFGGRCFKIGQEYNAPAPVVDRNGEVCEPANIEYLNVSWLQSQNELHWILGMTPHSLYTSRARGLECDTLIIDEAGQMTIPMALMGMIRAKKVILAGDHKQLPPIVASEEISKEMQQSVFQALMTEDNCTMLDVSFRMCEPICAYVSELFYDGKVQAQRQGCGDRILCDEPLYSFDAPIVVHHVDDAGEQTSEKEVAFIADTIAGYLARGLQPEEVAVLSPFRAQAAAVRRALRRHPRIAPEQAAKVTADTIDKMQGQEREVIIFSLVAGDPDYMADMAEFLYNPNKLNVAFSRAKSKLIIVGNIDNLQRISREDYPHIDKMIHSKRVTRV